MLLKSGAPLQTALQTIESGLVVHSLRPAMARVRTSVSQGNSLASAFAAEKLTTQSVNGLIKLGEETNQLEGLLLFAADAQERETSVLIDRFMALLVPVVTVLLGLLVGGIVMSVMRAILSINQVVLQ